MLVWGPMPSIDSKDKAAIRAHLISRSSKALWRKVFVSAHIETIPDQGTFPKIGFWTKKLRVSSLPRKPHSLPLPITWYDAKGKEWLKTKSSIKTGQNLEEDQKVPGLMLPQNQRVISSSSWSLAERQWMQYCHAPSLRKVLPGTAQIKRINRNGKWMANVGQ